MTLPQSPTRRGMSRFARAALFVTGLMALGEVTAAGPTVGGLLAVCDRAFAKGNTGLDAATCEWYAAPCACKLRDADGGALPWCVPDSEPIDAVVRKVVVALRRAPDRDGPAEAAIQDALERLYPCARAAGE
jgi:hypothetical protein